MPSHHSSSSHSSHSHSSHSSHSSYRSSSSRSSSSRSYSSSSHRPSSHSSSSHSSVSRSSSSGVTTRRTPPPRPRRNQPGGYQRNDRRQFQCRTHDYVYYPVAWTFGSMTYQPGYYDEEGNHYDSVAIKDEETICKCEYCGSLVKIKWDGGTLPNCEHCGAPLSVQVRDEGSAQTVAASTAGYNGTRSSGGANGLKIALIAIACFLGLGFCGAILDSDDDDRVDVFENGYESGYDDDSYGGESLSDSIYVDEIGRTCYLDGEDYYDEETGCWFYLNTDVEPPVWQYWYDGISSDYGDYGWMEYDEPEGRWYIQDENGDWIVLPGGYDTSYLWYIRD